MERIMTDDIVERLRAEVAYDELLPGYTNMTDAERLAHEAADEIESLREQDEIKMNAIWRKDIEIESLRADVKTLTDMVAQAIGDMAEKDAEIERLRADKTRIIERIEKALGERWLVHSMRVLLDELKEGRP